MKISVVVCTYNRCESLAETLQALLRQQLSDGLAMEIIVVDNNSSDRTPEVVLEASRGGRVKLQYVFEPRQGLSHARNRGVQEAQGDVIAFTDDDVIPEKNWAQALSTAFEQHHADFVGGKILPIWMQPPPGWMSSEMIWDKLSCVWALLDHGSDTIVIREGDGRFLFGANFAIRKHALEHIGVFNPNLGRKGSQLFSGDETDLMRRFLLAKKIVVYVPEAVVHHKVQPERMRMAYVRRWKFQNARCSALVLGQAGEPFPIWLFRESMRSGMKTIWAYGCGRREQGLKYEFHLWNQLGQLVGTWQRSRPALAQMTETFRRA